MFMDQVAREEYKSRVPKDQQKKIIEMWLDGYGVTGIARHIAKMTDKPKNVGKASGTVKRIINAYLER